MKVLPWVVAGLVLSACGAQPEPSSSIALRAASTEYYVSDYGVMVGIRVAFDQDRVVTGARLTWADESVEVRPYPLDGSDFSDSSRTSFELPAGTEMMVEGHVVAACPVAPSIPVFEVEATVDGRQRTERFRPDDEAGFDGAFFDWCRRPVTMIATGSRVTPQGDYELFLDISNPGPGTVTVVSRAVTQGESTWRPAQVDVPAGTIERLSVVGHGPPACAATAPWETGDLLANGTPIEPVGDGWC